MGGGGQVTKNNQRYFHSENFRQHSRDVLNSDQKQQVVKTTMVRV